MANLYEFPLLMLWDDFLVVETTGSHVKDVSPESFGSGKMNRPTGHID